MSDQKESRLSKFATTPLGIISLFVGLVETVLGVAAFETSGNIQLALTIFVIVFPLLIAAAFFYVLWNRPYVFYGPREFSDQTNVQEYVGAMQPKSEMRSEAEKLGAPPVQARALSSAEDSASATYSFSGDLQVEVLHKKQGDWIEVALAATKKGDFEEAYAQVEGSFGGGEVYDAADRAGRLAMWAFHLYEKGWDKGFDKLKQWSQEDTIKEEALSWLGLIYTKAGQWIDAVSCYKQARELASSDEERLSRTITLAKTLVPAGLPNEALAEIRQLLGTAHDPPREALLYKTLGEVLLKIYPLEPLLGIACFEKALSIQPTDTEMRFDVAYTHSEVITPAVSFYYYRKLLEEKEDHAIAKNNAGVAARELKLPITGVRYYKMSADQQETLAMANLGHELLEAGFEQEATKILEEARKEPNPHPNVDQWLGQLQKNRLAEEKKIEELDKRVGKVLRWRRMEAEALGREQVSTESLIGKYRDDSGSVLIVSASDDLKLDGEMTKSDEILTLSGHIHGTLISFNWKMRPASSSAITAPPPSLFSLGFGISRSESGAGAFIVQQSGKILSGYRSKSDDPLNRTDWTLLRIGS